MTTQRSRLAILAAFGIGLTPSAGAVESVGTLPAPTLTDIRATASATYDATNQLYTYSYDVSNGAANTGAIMSINIEMANKYFSGGWYNRLGLPPYPADKLTIPVGGNEGEATTFTELKQELEPFLLPPGHFLVPFGIEVPDGWDGSLSRDGYAAFDSGTHATNVLPGATMSGLKLISPGVPIIRDMIVEPFWVPVFEGEPDKSAAAKAGKVERAIRVHLKTLGPSGTGALNWSSLDAELAQAVQLGWIPDAALAQQIQAQLDAANAAAVQQQDGTTAKQQLGALLQVLAAASADRIRTEARDLVRLNAEALIRVIPDTPIPVAPEYSLEPSESVHAVGETATLIGQVVNSSDHNQPLADWEVRIDIASGPDAGKVQPYYAYTDANGKVTFSYRGQGLGTDQVLMHHGVPQADLVAHPILVASLAPVAIQLAAADGLPPGAVATALVHWQGGPDLAAPLFIPPAIKTQGGASVQFLDLTQNLGDQPAGASVTRYYLSKDEPVDPHAATVIAERHVPPLQPGEQSRGSEIRATVPADLPAGVYHLVACADADGQVIETDEQNNCSNGQLKNVTSVVVGAVPSNRPPVCSVAQPGKASLWPPNHKLRTVAIDGVTDPDGDPVTLTVTAIAQNEPVDGLGDGDTAPDGFGVGSARARVRAERSGAGQGRLYFIGFRAADGKGSTCTGHITVGVPHDQSAKGLPVDTGQRYDSTRP